MQGEVDDAVRETVTVDRDLETVTVRYIIDAAVGDRDGIVIIKLAECPCRGHRDATETSRNGVTEPTFDGLEISGLNHESRVPVNGDDYRGVIVFVDIQEIEPDRSIFIEILDPLDEFGLALINSTQVQPFGNIQHRGLGLQDDDLVVNGIHRRCHTSVGDVLQHRLTVVKTVPGDGGYHDLGVALVDAVSAVCLVIRYRSTYRRAEDKPVEVAEYGIEDVLAA